MRILPQPVVSIIVWRGVSLNWDYCFHNLCNNLKKKLKQPFSCFYDCVAFRHEIREARSRYFSIGFLQWPTILKRLSANDLCSRIENEFTRLRKFSPVIMIAIPDRPEVKTGGARRVSSSSTDHSIVCRMTSWRYAMKIILECRQTFSFSFSAKSFISSAASFPLFSPFPPPFFLFLSIRINIEERERERELEGKE